MTEYGILDHRVLHRTLISEYDILDHRVLHRTLISEYNTEPCRTVSYSNVRIWDTGSYRTISYSDIRLWYTESYRTLPYSYIRIWYAGLCNTASYSYIRSVESTVRIQRNMSDMYYSRKFVMISLSLWLRRRGEVTQTMSHGRPHCAILTIQYQSPTQYTTHVPHYNDLFQVHFQMHESYIFGTFDYIILSSTFIL